MEMELEYTSSPQASLLSIIVSQFNYNFVQATTGKFKYEPSPSDNAHAMAEATEDLQDHRNNLKRLCRLCGGKLKKSKEK